jgi:hypothetical protein
MQYKMYSDSPRYLPVMPERKFISRANESINCHVDDDFIFVGGKEKLYALNEVSGDATQLHSDQLRTLMKYFT